MKKIPKSYEAQRQELITKLTEAHDEINTAIKAFNEAMEEKREAVTDAVKAYNELIENAQELRDQIVQDISNFMAEKSDKWTEGETGQRYAHWLSVFESNLTLDEVTIDLPDEVEESTSDAVLSLKEDWVDEP